MAPANADAVGDVYESPLLGKDGPEPVLPWLTDKVPGVMANRFMVGSSNGAKLRRGAALDSEEVDAPHVPKGAIVTVAGFERLPCGKIRCRLKDPPGSWCSKSMLIREDPSAEALLWVASSSCYGTRRLVNAEGRPRLFCFPAAGTGSEIFADLKVSLAKEMLVIPVQVPGGSGPRSGEAFVSDLGDLAKRLADMLPLQDSAAPYAFLGASIGAVVAWALCKELQRRGDRLPVAFIASSQESPAHLEANPVWKFTAGSSEIAVAAELRASGFFHAVPDALWTSMGWLVPFVKRTRAELQLEIGIKTFRDAFAGSPPLPVPIAAFLGTADRITGDAMAAWEHETAASYSMTAIPDGEHLMISQPAVAGALFPLVSRVVSANSPPLFTRSTTSTRPPRPWSGT